MTLLFIGGSTIFDVIIVGARCAGASLAIFLGRLGYKVLLLDKSSKLGPTLSTHIIGEVDIYKSLNINYKIENCGSPILERFRVDVEGHIFESDTVVSNRVISIRRELLDSYLLQEVSKLPNIKVNLGFNVNDIIENSKGEIIGVTGKKKGCTSNQSFYGNIIVGADGRNSLISRKVSAKTTLVNKNEELGVVYAYIKGINPMPVGTVEWYWTPNGVVIGNPIDQNMHCFAIMVPPSKFKEICNPNGFIQQLYQLRMLVPRIDNLKIAGKIKGIKKVNSNFKKPYGKRWVLVGDSSAFLHPIAGVGIDNAVCTAEQLALQLDLYLKEKQSWEESMSIYQNLRDNRILPQFYSSVSTQNFQKTNINSVQHELTSMLCTFPSLAKKIALHSNQIMTMLQEGG
ncbi:NAD(P)/FAD-dependent oxidoreductase [Oceanobacillus sp. FSL K6-0127]|uniref:NAD(P)/FAD-dependent oxidoreductase n=1 Tax=Oceanobacillus sp. FSL K6-0127 TaxID=2921420 RepID=UPI0030EB51C2